MNIEEKLHISQHERDEQIVDICFNVRLAYRSIHAILDNAGRIKESSKSGTKMLCWSSKTTTSQTAIPKNNGCKSLTFLLHLK
jgi:hypothetical protein